ncbi:MAG: hypothetical protein COA57_09110 [Flavobacteriales bacterium]|nr:MAG: hypothetical protein COA57_09110 [Flavobacteriales bacterium]
MEKVISKLKTLSKTDLSFENLGLILSEFNFNSVNYKHLLPPAPIDGDYSRNILLMQPLECVILLWPPKAESAIHHHEGFWGYVAVLEGECDNIEYTLKDGILKESKAMRGVKGGIIPEQNGIIHKLINPSGTQPTITANFYYPPLKDFKGMKIFNLKERKIGILNEKAQSASWTEPKEHFEKTEENAFELESKNATHKIHPVIPKPLSKQIENMVSAYYSDQAHEYDHFDLRHNSRNTYTEKINSLIADDLRTSNITCVPERKEFQVSNLLTLACGTGRRAVDIREDSGLNYQITGIDLSEEMCTLSRKRGISTMHSSWLDVDLAEKQFDVCTFLYAFGHISTKKERKLALLKINRHLKPGASFYLDVFNVDDKNEWGPNAVKTFEKNNLQEHGYEKGDVFYRKMGGRQLAFLHYFTKYEICSLLEECGFQVAEIKHVGYVTKSGQMLENEDEGALFIKSVKR